MNNISGFSLRVSTKIRHFISPYLTSLSSSLHIILLLFVQSLPLPGAPGPAGDPGSPGCGEPLRPGFLLVIHNQSVEVPQCPAGSSQLWVGHSLIYFEGQEKARSQDLGKCLYIRIYFAHHLK